MLYKKTKKRKLAVFVLSTLMGVQAVALPFLITVAWALPPALIKARTIAELIVTLFAASGTAITNTPVLTSIYSNAGSSIYSFETLVEQGYLIPEDTSLTTQEAIDGLGTGLSYNVDTTGLRNYLSTVESTLEQNNLTAALTFEQLDNDPLELLMSMIKYVAENGRLNAQMTLAKLSHPGQTVVMTIEDLLDNILNAFGRNISQGLPITVDTTTMPWYGYDTYTYRYYADANHNLTRTWYINTNENTAACYYYANNAGRFYIYNPNNSLIRIDDVYDNNGQIGSSFNYYNNFNKYFTANLTSMVFEINIGKRFATESECLQYMQDLISGIENIPVNISPDLVNPSQGNIYDSQDITPALQPNHTIDIIPMADYTDYADDAQDNYENDLPADNAIVTDDFLSPYINEQEIVIPEEEIIPEQPSSLPIIYIPSSEELGVALDYTTSGLDEIFPFCIPFDLVKIVKKFASVERNAPHIEFHYHSDLFNYDIDLEVDLSEYDSVAELFRNLMLILFIIGLAINTRKLIGA